MPENAGDVTLLLQGWGAGSRTAENELFVRVMPNLRRLAHYMMSRERRGHTLQPTELVDQIYLRMATARDRDWQNRQHFFAVAARAMRRCLIEYARRRAGGERIGLEEVQDLIPADSAKLDTAVGVDRLLDQLAELKPEWCMVVELKYFLGLTDEEAADAMGLKLRTLQRMWRDARQWLFGRWESGHG